MAFGWFGAANNWTSQGFFYSQGRPTWTPDTVMRVRATSRAFRRLSNTPGWPCHVVWRAQRLAWRPLKLTKCSRREFNSFEHLEMIIHPHNVELIALNPTFTWTILYCVESSKVGMETTCCNGSWQNILGESLNLFENLELTTMTSTSTCAMPCSVESSKAGKKTAETGKLF